MRYSIEKKNSMSRIDRSLYISEYHTWLKKQREKDKEDLPRAIEQRGRKRLNRNRCPHCNKELKVNNDGKIIQKICDKHGVLQVIKNSTKYD